MLRLLASAIWVFVLTSDVTTSACPPCPQGAECIDGECVCSNDTIGDPRFDCYDPSEYYRCQVYYDPVLTLYRGESAKISLPASSALSNVQIIRNGGASDGELCALKVFTWTRQFGGKYFIEGVQFEFDQKTVKRGETTRIVRIIGTVLPGASNNTYVYQWEVYFYREPKGVFARVAVFQTNGKQKFARRISKCLTVFRRDEANFLTVSFDCCNQTIGLRPYNPYEPHIVSGVWVKVRRQPCWAVGLPWYLCGKPEGGVPINRLLDRHGFQSRSLFITMVGLTQDSPDDYPDAPDNLEATKDVLLSCPEETRKEFFEEASFLFFDAKLVHHTTATQRLALIHDLGKVYCQPDETSYDQCQHASDTIRGYISDNDTTESLREFLLDGCDKFKSLGP